MGAVYTVSGIVVVTYWVRGTRAPTMSRPYHVFVCCHSDTAGMKTSAVARMRPMKKEMTCDSQEESAVAMTVARLATVERMPMPRLTPRKMRWRSVTGLRRIDRHWSMRRSSNSYRPATRAAVPALKLGTSMEPPINTPVARSFT
jgi:hypothetical protein